MDWLLGALAALFLAAAVWFGWRHLLLRRRLESYTRLLKTLPGKDLPTNVPSLEDLSNAVARLAQELLARQNLLEAERVKLASVLDQMTDGVLIADASGMVTFANPAATRILGAHPLVGRSVAEAVRHYQLIETWQRSRETGVGQNETLELPARRQFLQFFALPDRQSGGSLLLIQDLTRLRRLETVRRDFISNLSHELRTPLASLKALTETLRSGALADPQAAPRFLGRIETEVDALAQMAQELLDLSRIEAGQSELKLAAITPAVLLGSAAERMRAQAERAGLALTVQATGDLPEVRVDRARLEQVLVNLIHNAVKFTPPGGEVTLFAEREGESIRFAVQDTGIGIPEDDLPRIFERFYQVDRSRTGSGTGLGLSIARHIVEAHGGRIWAESVEGEGSTFFFTIPAG